MARSAATHPSGRQFELVRGALRATVAEVGAGLREFVAGARPVLDGYGESAVCDGARGAILAPWPNRLRDGRYAFEGRQYQLDLSEPARHNAIHGLVRWRSWRPLRREADRVVLALRLWPTPGYPFTLDLRADYRLAGDGLEVAITAENAGSGRLPYALGQHPYLFPGPGGVDRARLAFAASTRLTNEPKRALPVGREAVRGTAFDFARGREVGEGRLDDAFTDLERDAEGRARVRLQCADGQTLELWLGPAFRYLQVYTGDDLSPGRRRQGLAVEPMTAPADALRTGEALVILGPGERHTASWGVRLL